MNKNVYVDVDTGEAFSKEDFYLGNYQNDLSNKKKISEYVNYKNKGISENDYFLFCFYNMCESFKDLKPADVARLIYLSTFIKFKDPNKTYSDKESVLTNKYKEIITREHMKLMFNVGMKTVDLFLSEVIGKGYLIPVEIKNVNNNRTYNGYKINEKIIYRGYIPDKKIKVNHEYTRLFIIATRNLFESVKPTHHVYLGYMYKLLPYINHEWNILCKNPEETDLHKIEQLSVNDVCDIVGYDRHNKKRLLKAFKDVTFKFKNEHQRLIKYCRDDDVGGDILFTNPNLFYAGTHYDRVEVLTFFFKERIVIE